MKDYLYILFSYYYKNNSKDIKLNITDKIHATTETWYGSVSVKMYEDGGIILNKTYSKEELEAQYPLYKRFYGIKNILD